MEIRVFCSNCKVEILRADTDTLKTPLIGSMFKVKKDMEWSLFSPHDQGNDLTCPMCDWTFHDNGKVSVAVGDDFVFGKPEVIIPGILAGIEVPLPVETNKEAVIPVVEVEDIKNKAASHTLVNIETIAEDATPNPALEALQKQVEGNKAEEKTEKLEQARINQGDWSEPSNINEGIDEEAKIDPRLQKGGRPKGSKNKGAKYQKWWKSGKKSEQTA